MDFGKNKDALYACGVEGGGVAGMVHYDPATQLIEWYQPGGRQRRYEVAEVLEDSEERFAFRDRLGRKFLLQPLTPELYNEHVRLPGQPRYPTMAALLYAYQQSLRNS